MTTEKLDRPYDPDRELEELYTAITGRPSFSYDPGTDPLYRAAADRYVQNGRRAMRDTMGQAASLTGGYASSYAQGVGQQRYDEYLRSLSDALPELYGLAWQRYSAQGDALRDAYDRTWQRREDAYQRGRDALADERYAAEQDIAAAERAEQQRQTQYKQQQDSYKKLYTLISTTGYEPTDAELEEAGLSRAQAEALRYEFQRLNGLLPTPYEPAPVYYGTAGSKKSSGSGKNDTASAANLAQAASVVAGTLAGLAKTVLGGKSSSTTTKPVAKAGGVTR